jgi:isoleucyl-tRNA synthetase
MPELERLMLHQLAEQAAIVTRAYAEFDYKTVVASLAAFMNTELSAFYFDIRKDTLYCDPPSSLKRKAALTTIDILCDAILKWLAPVLSFTTEEAWRLYKPNAEPSVHLTLFPEGLEKFRNEDLTKKWDTVRMVRYVVTGALEVERAAKRIGSSLEASPMIYVDSNISSILFDVDLPEVFITSNAMVTSLRFEDTPPANAFTLNSVPGVAVVVERAIGTKCARSWKILPDVGDDPEYPDVSLRDAQALREWKALDEVSTPAATPVLALAQIVDVVVAAPEVSQKQNVEKKPVEVSHESEKPAKRKHAKTTPNGGKSPEKSVTKGRKKDAAKDAPAEEVPTRTTSARKKTAKKAKKKKAAETRGAKPPSKGRKSSKKSSATGRKKDATKSRPAKKGTSKTEDAKKAARNGDNTAKKSASRTVTKARKKKKKVR